MAISSERTDKAIGNFSVVAVAFVAIVVSVLVINAQVSARICAVFVLGGALGLTLYHAAYGFTSAWRAFVIHRHGAGVRSQMLMLALASALFVPAISSGELAGQPVVGAVAPLSVSLAVGAFLFGLGMQLGGGCGSGTLYTVGGGNARMLITLSFFMLGSLLGTAHVPWWFEQAQLPAVSLAEHYGVMPALTMQWVVMAIIVVLTLYLERRSPGGLTAQRRAIAASSARLWRGPWPILIGAVVLALLNFATLVLAGHPWGITYGITLWAAKIAQGLGVDLSTWEFWTWSYHRHALSSSVLENTTSVMNFGLLLGALMAAGLAGRFAPTLRVPWRSLLAAAIGGLLMGYGARLAFGCNIGAYVGGVASASVHGWVWFVIAMAGTCVGVRLRPVFGLPN